MSVCKSFELKKKIIAISSFIKEKQFIEFFCIQSLKRVHTDLFSVAENLFL